MRFEWDEAKRRLNLRRHGFDFVVAEKVFNGESFTILDDRFDYGEIRFVTLGLLNGVVIAIAHLETDDVTRILSVRRASRNEEEIYFKQITD